MSDKPDKTRQPHADGLVETPLFGRFREWWKAKKCSLDLWGMEKFLGVDNRVFKQVLMTYKSLLVEIDAGYDAVAKNPQSTTSDIEEARKRRDQGLLDAKRDFVYEMPEDYRGWFKKNKIYSSWRTSPESWGFEESRYWGSRSGLSLRERRVVVLSLTLGLIALGFWLFRIALYQTPSDDVAEFASGKSTENVDSLLQAKRMSEQRVADDIRRRNLMVWRKDRIINEINEGFYTTSTRDMRADIVEIMQFYVDKVHNQTIMESDIPASHVRAAMALIGRNNAAIVTKRDDMGIPFEWKPNRRAKVAWTDVNGVLDRLFGKRK